MITIALIFAVWLIAAWAVAVRVGHALHRRRPAAAHAQFYAVPDGTRYLACHNAGLCGHMQTPHVPAGPGFWRCTTAGCDHITKGD